jgi:hypothetical protein
MQPLLAPRGTPHIITALALALALRAEPLALAVPSQARRMSDSQLGIAAEAPPGWIIARRTGFAETVFLLLFPDGSRISLSAEKTAIHSTAELVEQNRQGLSRQGFVVARSAAGPGAWVSLEVDVPSRGEKLRQLYQVRSLANENQALVLTLVSSAKNFAFHGDALTFVVERMTLENPTPPSATPATKNNAHPRPPDASPP